MKTLQAVQILKTRIEIIQIVKTAAKELWIQKENHKYKVHRDF